MPVVKIPAEFFVRERNTVYSDWQFAFWRELTQNSVDAGATEIKIHGVVDGDMYRVTFDDNGCGMDIRVLEDVYFALGRTTKTDGTTAGGFARARILTNFAMDHYEIHTNGNYVRGSGAEYDIAVSYVHPPGKTGCVQIIWIPMKDINHNPEIMFQKLIRYLSYCYFDKVKFSFNDNEINQDHSRQMELAKTRPLMANGHEFAKVYVDSKGLDGYVNVRVLGNSMMMIFENVQKPLVVELDPKLSREILAASRDSFKKTYADAYREYIQAARNNSRHTVIVQRERVVTFQGGGRMVSSRREARIASPQAIRQMVENGTHERVFHTSMVNLARVKDSPGLREEFFKNFDITNINGYHTKASDFIPTTKVRVYSNDEEFHKKALDWMPQNWEMVIKNNSVLYGKWYSKYQLLAAWHAAVKYCVDLGVNTGLLKTDQIVWITGFELEDHQTAIASCSSESDGSYTFFINPIDEEFKPRYDLKNRSHLKRIAACAMHEVTHVVGNGHDEEFARVLTMMIEECEVNDIIREMKVAAN